MRIIIIIIIIIYGIITATTRISCDLCTCLEETRNAIRMLVGKLKRTHYRIILKWVYAS